MDGTCLAEGMVAGKESTWGGGVQEDLAEVGWSAEVDVGVVLRKL